MFIGSLLPHAFAAWKPRQAASVSRVESQVWFNVPVAVHPESPGNVIAIDAEVRSALAAVSGLAHDFRIELQMACEPNVLAMADQDRVQSCLRELIAAAIDRADSGVLVTATIQAGETEIAILDDGDNSVDRSSPGQPTQTYKPVCSLPAGARLMADYKSGRGTTVTLRIPGAFSGGSDSMTDTADVL
jgi:hypothetical protein